jgi:dihydrophenazinedicarboxylate synthase
VDAHPSGPPEFAGPPAEPASLLRQWLADAEAAGEAAPFTAVLATADASGQPSTRCVTVRSCEERGLVMFMNLDTRKGRDLRGNPRAAATFWWSALFRQVNVTGRVERLSAAESGALWEAKGPSSQIAAVVSRQGARLHDRGLLTARAAELAAAGSPVARPQGQAGVLLVPETAEFWVGQADRLHHRLHYGRTATGWETCLLQP